MSARILDWAKTDLLRALQEHCSVEVRSCVWLIRGMEKRAMYDPIEKKLYILAATSVVNPILLPKMNAQRIAELVNCKPQVCPVRPLPEGAEE